MTCGAKFRTGHSTFSTRLCTPLMPGMSGIKHMTVREGVQVEPTPCGKCGRMTVSRIESPDGQVGCLDCLRDFLVVSLKLS
jgi:hypothetical protein